MRTKNRRGLFATVCIFLLAVSVLFEFASSATAVSNQPSLLWSKAYAEASAAFDAIETSDGGFALAGENSGGFRNSSPILLKTDSFGNLEWEQTYNKQYVAAQSVAQSQDRGFAISGYGGWFFRTDASGNVQLTQVYGLSSRCAVINTTDGGYAFAGYDANNPNNAYLIKANQNGVGLWEKTFRDAHNDVLSLEAIETNDQGYVIAGNWASIFWSAKVDSAGNLQWNRTYPVTSGFANAFFAFYSLAETKDNGLILCGGDGHNSWLVKTDGQGNMQWKQSYAGNLSRFMTVAQMENGNYLAGGADGKVALFVETDSAGNLLWNETFGNPASSSAVSKILLVNGGFVLAGYQNGEAWLAEFSTDIETAAATPSPSVPEITIPVVFLTLLVAAAVSAVASLRKAARRR